MSLDDFNAAKIMEVIESDSPVENFASWPLWAKKSFVKTHKTRNERFYLWVFLWRNGVTPQKATYWTMMHGGYDKDAWRSITDLERKARTPEGRAYLAKPRVMILATGRPESSNDHPLQEILQEPPFNAAQQEAQAIESMVLNEEIKYLRRKAEMASPLPPTRKLSKWHLFGEANASYRKRTKEEKMKALFEEEGEDIFDLFTQ